MTPKIFLSILLSTIDIVDKYKKRLEGMDKDIKDILKQEEEEKQVFL